MRYESNDVNDVKSYNDLFSTADKDAPGLKEVLDKALDIRKFEIDLYWRRATYFWAFIAATFAGYFAIFSADKLSGAAKQEGLFILSCIGLVFSFGWFLANKGSKFWQENWEKHVDMLESRIYGPLYKTTLAGKDFKPYSITGPFQFSVSKINQVLSAFVTLIWFFIWVKMILSFFSLYEPFQNAFSIFVTGLTIISLCYLYFGTRTSILPKSFNFITRKIKDDKE